MRICGDVIGVGNFWREVPETAEAGSKTGDLLVAIRGLERMSGISHQKCLSDGRVGSNGLWNEFGGQLQAAPKARACLQAAEVEAIFDRHPPSGEK
jgi:hypothetical protein